MEPFHPCLAEFTNLMQHMRTKGMNYTKLVARLGLGKPNAEL